MWIIATRSQYTKFLSSLKVTVHQIFITYLLNNPRLLSGELNLQFSPVPVKNMTRYKPYSRLQYTIIFWVAVLHIKHSLLLYMFCYPEVTGSAMLLLLLPYTVENSELNTNSVDTGSTYTPVLYCLPIEFYETLGINELMTAFVDQLRK